jgi:hypothetical protein
MLPIDGVRNCRSFGLQHSTRKEYGSGIDAAQVSAVRDGV